MPEDTHLDREHTRGWVNVASFGARGDGATDDTPRFLRARAAGRRLYVPDGVYLLDDFAFAESGSILEGESPRGTILKATGRSSRFLSIDGTIGGDFLTHNVIRNLSLDVSGMADLASGVALYLAKTWGNIVEQLYVSGNGANKLSIFAENPAPASGVYSSEFRSCDVGSTTGKIKLQGITLNDAITTLTFTACSFGQLIADQAFSTTLISPIVQGALDAYVLSAIRGFRIFGGHHENTGGYLVLGPGVPEHLYSIGNIVIGPNPYMSGTFSGGALMDLTNLAQVRPYVFSSKGFSPGDLTGAPQAGSVYQGSGAPPAGNGNNGDVYFRIDTPAVANQRIYVRSAGAWVGVL